MKRLLIAVAAAAVLGMATAPAASALSPGCEQLNVPGTPYNYDGVYNRYISTGTFAAGERLSMSAAPPNGDPSTTTLFLRVHEGELAGVGPYEERTAPFPGTLEYTIPASGTYTLIWGASTLENLTWTVTCSAAAVNVPTTKEQCKNGGWRSFGTFKNQGACVSFVAKRGKTPRRR